MSKQTKAWQNLHSAEYTMEYTLESFGKSAVERDIQLILKSDRYPLSRRKLKKAARAELRELRKETKKISLWEIKRGKK